MNNSLKKKYVWQTEFLYYFIILVYTRYIIHRNIESIKYILKYKFGKHLYIVSNK